MSNVVALKSKTIEQMVDQIHREFATAASDTKRADRARLRAGRLLIELRGRIEAGEVGQGVKWWKWHKENIARSKRDSMKVMRLASAADPEAAHDEEKAERAARRDQSQVEHDLVFEALCLVEQMNADQRQKFFAELRSIYAYTD